MSQIVVNKEIREIIRESVSLANIAIITGNRSAQMTQNRRIRFLWQYRNTSTAAAIVAAKRNLGIC